MAIWDRGWNIVKSTRVNSLLLFFLAVVLSACSLHEDKETAKNQVLLFHKALDAGQGEALYENSSDHLKRAAKKTEFIAYLNIVHEKLGNVKNSKQISSNINYGTDGSYVTLGYETEFHKGTGTERFIYRVNGKKARLYSYRIDSSALTAN
jgi:Protein of unknown function (DUF4019)